MNRDPPIQLSITPEGIDAFCGQLRRSSASAGRAVAGLAALQTFLAQTTQPAEKASTSYEAIRKAVAVHLDAASQAVIAQASEQVAEGIRRRDPVDVAAVHRILSRSGFHEALRQAAGDGLLEPGSAKAWATIWCSEAEQRAEAASGYPDAYDFAAADIALEHYTAMRDLRDSGI